MRHGSLFSGIGGFDLAAYWVGWQNIFQVEIDPFCRHVLKTHFPFSEQHDDIKKFKGGKYNGTIDIISGGFPCQPFSLAGKRKGTTDNRYLWPEALRVIQEIHPAWIVLENVAGLFTILEPESLSEMEIQEIELYSQDQTTPATKTIIRLQRRIIGSIISQIRSAGYLFPQLTDGTPIVLCIPACAVGAPHRRDRVWLVAYSGNDRPHESQNGQSTDQGNDDNEARQETIIQPERRSNPPTGTAFTDTYDESKQQKVNPDWSEFGQQREQLRSEFNTTGKSRIITNTDSFERSQGRMYPPGPETPERFLSAFHSWNARNPWQNFPTESPVCGRDDGLPYGLVDISISKWRRESIRSFGNAIVPQVAFEIFNAINFLKNNHNNLL